MENNIQNIISNQFSKNSNYSVKLDDVDFNFSGDLSFDNVIIFNNNKDTLFYSPKILVNPTSVQNAVINNEYDFDKIVIQKGSFFIENFNDFDEIEKSYSLNSENKLLIKTLLLSDFRIINSDNTNNINFDINDFIISKNNIDFSLKNSNIKLNEIDQINSINSNVNISKDNLNLNDVSLVYKNSNINLNVFIEKTNNLLIVDEDVPGGASAYILQQLLEKQKIFKYLDSEPVLLSAKSHRPAYGSDGDYFSKPSFDDIYDSVYNIMHNLNPKKYPKI